MSMSQSPSQNAIPQTAADVICVLQNIPIETDKTRLAFGIAGAIFIASWKANLFKPGASDTEKFSFFFKFTSSIDPNLRLGKTLERISGVFLNYIQNITENRLDREARALLDLLLMKLGETASCDNEQQKKVMQSLLQVRNACYTYVLFSNEWSNERNGRFRDLDEAVARLL